MTLLMAIDSGQFNVKMIGEEGEMLLSSAIMIVDSSQLRMIGDYRTKGGLANIKDRHRTVKGDNYYYGIAAENESYSEDRGRYYDADKNDIYMLDRVLISIAHYMKANHIVDTNIKVCVGQTYKSFNQDSTNDIKEFLKGSHVVTLDNKHNYSFTIESVLVLSEGFASFVPISSPEACTIFDIGSSTTHVMTFNSKQLVNNKSSCLVYGTNKLQDISMLSKSLINDTKKNNKVSDQIYIVGGIAEKIEGLIQKYYVNAKVYRPTIYFSNGKVKELPPSFANAAGMWQVVKTKC